jgi:hypothetical protein
MPWMELWQPSAYLFEARAEAGMLHFARPTSRDSNIADQCLLTSSGGTTETLKAHKVSSVPWIFFESFTNIALKFVSDK